MVRVLGRIQYQLPLLPLGSSSPQPRGYDAAASLLVQADTRQVLVVFLTPPPPLDP